MLKTGFDFLTWGTRVGSLLVLLLGCVSFARALPHFIELITHFRLQYFFVSLLLSFVFLLNRDWQWLVIGFIAIIINSIGVFPWHIASPRLSEASDRPILRLLHSNVLSSNKQYAKLMALVAEEKPDIIMLQETTENWMEALESLKEDFPYFLSSPGSDDPGIALFSRLPLHHEEFFHLGTPGAPSIRINFTFQGQEIALLSTHLSSPRLGSNFRARNVQLEDLVQVTKDLSLPSIVMGDLNITMWSPYYRKFVKEAGLRNVRDGLGIFPTWPTFLPILMIPIDHAFITEGLKVTGVKTGKHIGSDHLPLIIDLSL